MGVQSTMPTTVKVSHDNHQMRPKTSPAFVKSASGSRSPSIQYGSRSISNKTSRGASRGTSRGTSRGKDKSDKDGEYHVELLEYEWPDLPPLPRMKDAITRQKVSKGIQYILPVDKGQNSINNQFRTDLRAMFQEPYANDDLSFDDAKINLAAHAHFDANAIDTNWTQKRVESIPVLLNSESEKVRKIYARSAPARAGREMGLDADKLQTRSSLFLPIKKEEHPEAQKLREEVEKMIEDIYMDDKKEEEKQDSDVDEGDVIKEEPNVEYRPRRKSYRYSIGGHGHHGKQLIHKKPQRLKLTAEKFKTYEQLKKTKPPKMTVPERFRSKYLDFTKNQSIWDWLHHGEQITEFDFFLSVCG